MIVDGLNVSLRQERLRLLSWIFVLTLSVHLVAEVIRRFAYYSSVPYFLADLTVMGALLVAVSKFGMIRSEPMVSIGLGLYLLWGGACLVLSGNEIALLAIGLRPIILAVAAFAISQVYFRTHPRALEVLLNCLAFWVVIILATAVLQLILGVDASINVLPDEASAKYGGMGTYDVSGDIFVSWLFRPTSIFMHTGRFGQYSFFAAIVFCVIYLVAEERSRPHWAWSVLYLAPIVISGQRAAAVFLIASVAVAAVWSPSGRALGRGILAVSFLGLIVVALPEDVSEAIIGRIESGFLEGAERIASMLQYWGVSFATYPTIGEGLGFFSFGGQPFGGHIYYEFMYRLGGGGETSWLRVQGETGILGLMLFLSMILACAWSCYTRARLSRTDARAIHLTAALYVFFSAIWALTHDVYANYLFVMCMAVMVGASVGAGQRELAQAIYLGRNPIWSR